MEIHPKHEQWIDVWKGILISLVVIGHVVGTGVHQTEGFLRIILERIFEIVYIFHMPAFFFLVGYVGRPSDERFKNFTVKKVNRLLVPYFTFGIISALIFYFYGTSNQGSMAAITDNYYATLGATKNVWTPILALLHGGKWPNGEGFRCNSVLWFLPCMFTVQLGWFWISRFWQKKYLLGGCALLFAVVASELNYMNIFLPWGLSLAPWFMVFVLIGYFVGQVDVFRAMFKLSNLWRWLIIAGLLVALFFFSVACCKERGIINLTVRIIFAIIGIFATSMLAFQVRGWFGRILGACGVFSLGIMLMHKFVVVALQLKVGIIARMVSQGLLSMIIALSLVAIIAIGISYWISVLIVHWMPWMLGVKQK